MKIPDYHVHPDFGFDARGSIRDYAQAAVAKGLEEICFTTHLDLDPVRAPREGWVKVNGAKKPNTDPGWVKSYLEEIEVARELFSKAPLRIKAGLEVDYFPEVEILLEPFLSFPWDFLLASVHCINHLAVAGEKEGAQLLSVMSPAQVAREFAAQAKRAIASGFFNGLAHLDYFKRLRRPGFKEKFLNALKPYLEEILVLLRETGMALEINTRGVTKYGLREPFPGPEIISLAASLGLEVITLGSDSHNPYELAQDFGEGVSLATKAGLNKVYTFKGGKIERAFPITEVDPIYAPYPA